MWEPKGCQTLENTQEIDKNNNNDENRPVERMELSRNDMSLHVFH